ncbi:hypothetical protein PGB90_001469 [Kerria lacca]
MPSSKTWKYGNKIPGPKPIPIVGNGLIFFKAKNFLKNFLELSYKYGHIYRLWLGKKLFVILSDPDDIEKFLSRSTHLNKTETYRLLDKWLGNKGLLTSDADVWRNHRKILTPAFHFKMLENSVPTMKKNAQILSQQLEKKINQPEFDIESFIEKCSLDIISETAMGIMLNTQTSDDTVYLNSLKKILTSFIQRAFQPWLQPEFVFKLSTPGKTYFEMLSVINDYNKKIIMNRKITLEKEKIYKPQENNDENSRKKPKPFLDILLTESNFTDEEIQDEVHTFMFAGHDTTTSATSFCLYALSNNQRVQDKLYDEIKTNLLSKDTEPTYQDYMNMKYLECVIKETMRIYTTIPMFGRKVEEDIQLPSGYTIPKGTLVNFLLIRTHNDERYFPNPTQFKPERFENSIKHPYSFLPFSAGLRNCIGQRFAILEMKTVITTLLSKYQFLPATKVTSIELEMKAVLRSIQKMPLRIVERN